MLDDLRPAAEGRDRARGVRAVHHEHRHGVPVDPVERVGHPLLASHESHALAQRMLPRGAGSVFSFDLRATRAQGKAFIEALQLFSHLANVGDCRSLVIHPASTTHSRMDDAALAAAGIGAGTIRLSIGLEDPQDLIADLQRALKAAEKAGGKAAHAQSHSSKAGA